MSDLPPKPDHELDWPELAAAIFAAKGIHEGLWRIAVKLRFAGLTTNWGELDGSIITSPTGMVGFEGIALFKAEEPGAMVFCAGEATDSTVVAAKSSKKAAPRKRTRQVPAKT